MADAERPFIFRWRDGVWNSDMKPGTKLVLMALSDWADTDGTNCYPTEESIAGRASLGVKAVRENLNLGSAWFTRAKRGRSAGQAWANYWYRLVLPEGANTASARQSKGQGLTPSPSMKRCGQIESKVRAMAEEGPGLTPDEVTNQLNKSNYTERAIPVDETLRMPAGLSRNQWEKWCDTKGAGYTREMQEAELALIDMHVRNGHDPVKLVKLAIARGWKGIYAKEETLVTPAELAGESPREAAERAKRMKSAVGRVRQNCIDAKRLRGEPDDPADDIPF